MPALSFFSVAELLRTTRENMTIKALRTVAKAQVGDSNSSKVSQAQLTRHAEWPRRIHPPMQKARLPLLRLGWKLQGHEVCLTISAIFYCVFRDTNNLQLAASSSLYFPSSLPQTLRSNLLYRLAPANIPLLLDIISTDAQNPSACET